jgi:hypothetical protein
MTRTQQEKLEQYRRLADVFSKFGLPVATLPPMLRGVKRFRAALGALEDVAARKVPEDASAWEKRDHDQLVAAAYDAVGSAIKDGIEPHLEFFATTAPRFFGAIRAVMVSRQKT